MNRNNVDNVWGLLNRPHKDVYLDQCIPSIVCNNTWSMQARGKGNFPCIQLQGKLICSVKEAKKTK